MGRPRSPLSDRHVTMLERPCPCCGHRRVLAPLHDDAGGPELCEDERDALAALAGWDR